MRLWERNHDTLEEDLQAFGRGFTRIRKTWERFRKDLQDFGRVVTGICKSLGEDLQGFVSLWESICKDSQD